MPTEKPPLPENFNDALQRIETVEQERDELRARLEELWVDRNHMMNGRDKAEQQVNELRECATLARLADWAEQAFDGLEYEDEKEREELWERLAGTLDGPQNPLEAARAIAREASSHPVQSESELAQAYHDTDQQRHAERMKRLAAEARLERVREWAERESDPGYMNTMAAEQAAQHVLSLLSDSPSGKPDQKAARQELAGQIEREMLFGDSPSGPAKCPTCGSDDPAKPKPCECISCRRIPGEELGCPDPFHNPVDTEGE